MVAANAAAHKIDAFIAIDASIARSGAFLVHKHKMLLSDLSFSVIGGRCKEVSTEPFWREIALSRHSIQSEMKNFSTTIRESPSIHNLG
jgi:hypothetical protein